MDKILTEKEIYNELMEECINSYNEEAVTHFLTEATCFFKNDGRFFYSKKELIAFIVSYQKKGGDLSELYCSKIYDDDEDKITKYSEFLCYGVYHKDCYEKHNKRKSFNNLFENLKEVMCIER